MNILSQLYRKNPYAQQIQLEFLQILDLTTSVPILAQFTKLKYLSLHGNRLKSLPDMSDLLNLQQLDITNNNFSSVYDFIQGLQTIPNLSILHCDYKVKDQKDELIKCLPKLRYLNKTQIKKQKLKKQQNMVSKNQQSKFQVEKINNIYSELAKLYQKSDLDIQEVYYSQFNDQIQLIKKQLQNYKKNVSNSKEMIQSKTISYKFRLMEFIFNKLVIFFQRTDPNLMKFFQSLKQTLFNEFKQFSRYGLYKEHDISKQIDEPRMKKVKKYLVIIQNLRKRQEALVEEVSKLQIQNRTYLQKIKQFGLQYRIQKKQQQPKTIHKSKQKILNNKQNIQNQNFQFLKSSKPINLHQFKLLITDIYKSKKIYDAQSYQLQTALQTMEEYLYIYFNKKYGFKQITIQWVVHILNGLKLYAQKDPFVYVFGKVLRNQFEEDFFNSQSQLKKIVYNLIQKKRVSQGTIKKDSINYDNCIQILKSLYSINNIESIKQNLQKSLNKNKQFSHKKSQKKLSSSQPDNQNIPLDIFWNAIAQFQIKEHEDMISDFIKKFRLVDKDKDGCINDGEFRILYLNLVRIFSENDFKQICMIGDPFNKGIFTYSTLCSLLQQKPQSRPIICKNNY